MRLAMPKDATSDPCELGHEYPWRVRQACGFYWRGTPLLNVPWLDWGNRGAISRIANGLGGFPPRWIGARRFARHGGFGAPLMRSALDRGQERFDGRSLAHYAAPWSQEVGAGGEEIQGQDFKRAE